MSTNLIIDSRNLFIRSYSAYPSMTENGDQSGGCVGFLKTLVRLVSDFHPSAVFVVWESGGSTKRRGIYKEYKEGRKPEKMNRYYEGDLPESNANQVWQLETLTSILECLPVCQVYVTECEGDDVIAYLCKYTFLEEDKIIVSSDRDMYQLLNENTRAYDLHTKSIVTPSDVYEKFKITPQNFALAKSIMGDRSDNIPGIKGIGPKTVPKLFPQLGGVERVLVQDVIDYASSHITESRFYKKVVDDADVIRRNWRLVNLDSLTLSSEQSTLVDNVVSSFVPTINKLSYVRVLKKAQLQGIFVDDHVVALRYLSKSSML